MDLTIKRWQALGSGKYEPQHGIGKTARSTEDTNLVSKVNDHK